MSCEPKQVRVWMDGCFDMAHYGHANALRQAKQLGDVLVAGVCCDEDIIHHKGIPVFNSEERYRMVRAIRWVDEVVEACPYECFLETLDKYNCDFCVHGDDTVISADGADCYKLVKDAGRFQEVPRTVGVSTTDLVGRLLTGTRSNSSSTSSATSTTAAADNNVVVRSPYTGGRSSNFCSCNLLASFSEKRRRRQPTDKVIYVAGAFDLFHVGHLAFLEAAAAQGTYLVVGIHDDRTVTSYKGSDRPLLSLYERVLCVLAYRCVDDVVMGVPYDVTAEVLDAFNVTTVFHGGRSLLPQSCPDPYMEPKRRGIFRLVDSGCAMTTDSLIDRIISNCEKYRERNKKKEAKEISFINQSK